ncbi:MAG: HD domain-containing protein [Flavobacteriaceae bacterium]|nr:HD domain-containing protein [Flavobacteriaceae bacterium]
MSNSHKLKIINDPIYGFIPVHNELIFQIIEHPYVQRLRHISQMGLSYLVYPGAHHTRFHHALGAMFLMQRAVATLRQKRVDISSQEEEALYLAILLHDIGHGPFSHGLEGIIVPDMSHEELSLAIMDRLNKEYSGALDLAIEIFTGRHTRKFLKQLVSGQLDMDRLDFLRRDSFYTGVAEGSISAQRLIAMLNVVDDCLVVEEKGIHSVENFLVARRLMYWQVYLHKASLCAEHILMKIIMRARELKRSGMDLGIVGSFNYFLSFDQNQELSQDSLNHFLHLDDIDILAALKLWMSHDDFVLSQLSKTIIKRKLFKIKIHEAEFSNEKLEEKRQKFAIKHNLSAHEASYFVFTGSISNLAYNQSKENIKLLRKDGSLIDVAQASDQLHIKALSEKVVKYFQCYPKTLE